MEIYRVRVTHEDTEPMTVDVTADGPELARSLATLRYADDHDLAYGQCAAITTEIVPAVAEGQVYAFKCVFCQEPLRGNPGEGLLVSADGSPYCSTELPGFPGRRRPRGYHRWTPPGTGT